MSLAYNTEIVVQMLPCLTSLSELPESLKRYEPQLCFALDALKLDNRMLIALAATLQLSSTLTSLCYGTRSMLRRETRETSI